MILALILFAVTYVLMLWLQQYRPWVALCSAVLFIVLGEAGVYEFSLRAALQAVDYNVLLMMAGTMGTVALFIESKMPARLAEMLIVRVPDVKWAVCMLALFAGALYAMSVMPQNFFPNLDKPYFRADCFLPDGYNIRDMERQTARLDRWLRDQPSVRTVSVTMGSSPPRYYLASPSFGPKPNFANVLVEL